MKAMKFHVKSPEESAAVQKKLFEMGCAWLGYDSTIQFTDKQYLYVSGKFITYSPNTRGQYFIDHENEEKNIDEFLGNLKRPNEVKLSNIFGKLYIESEVIEALKALKTYTI